MRPAPAGHASGEPPRSQICTHPLIRSAYFYRMNYDFDLCIGIVDHGSMFNFRRNENAVDTSLFDPEYDMDLVLMINEARSEHELQSVMRMSRARMRARRRQLGAARRAQQDGVTRARGHVPHRPVIRGF